MIAGILIGMSAYHYLTRLGPGDRAPDFVLPDIANRDRALQEYRGKVVILHFWATWCQTCLMEMPAIEHINRIYEDRGLAIVAVLEDRTDAAAKLQAFEQRVPLNFPVLLDREGTVAELYESYAVPETFVIDRDGVILKRISGGIDWNGVPYMSYIEKLLKE